MKYKVEMIVSKEQLYAMNRALEFYLRMGICHFSAIDVHSGLEQLLMEKYRPKKEIEVGDSTTRGEVIDMKDGKSLVRGHFVDGIREEWVANKDLVHSVDYSAYHKEIEDINKNLSRVFNSPSNGNLGVHNSRVGESSKICADIHNVLRNKIYRLDHPNDDHFCVKSFAPQFSISKQNLPKIKIKKYDADFG